LYLEEELQELRGFMDHKARFGVDSLHKQYPEPDRIPDDTYLVFVRDRNVVVTKGNPPTILQKISPDLPERLKRRAQYLGHRGFVPCYSIEVAGDLPLPEGLEDTGVRDLAGLIPDQELAIAALAVQVTGYDRTTRFCGRCGTKTELAMTERAKVCPSCHQVIYPRLSPAVIVLVRNNHSILMVRRKGAAPGRYGLIAGFVEQGETIEQAVFREVHEEAMIGIKNIRYRASEPWPFPDSIMLGFVADYDKGEIAPDGIEIECAGWFDRGHLPDLPPRFGMTRALIDDWIADPKGGSSATKPHISSGKSNPTQFPGINKRRGLEGDTNVMIGDMIRQPGEDALGDGLPAQEPLIRKPGKIKMVKL
jgi:NAD+ diphosphatase